MDEPRDEGEKEGRSSRMSIFTSPSPSEERNACPGESLHLDNAVAAVDADLGAGHEARRVAGEENDGTLESKKVSSYRHLAKMRKAYSKVLWVTHPAHWRQAFPGLFEISVVCQDGLCELGQHVSWAVGKVS